MNKLREKSMGCVFLVTALASIFAVIIICLFLFANGLPTIAEIGPFDFLLGTTWKPTNDIYGIFPMILGSIYVTAGSLIIGVPVGLLCAVYLARFCPPRVYKYLKPAVDLLAGIPSIVYGFFGLVVIVPIMRDLFGGSGKSVLTASILLGIMILPTLISVGEASIRAVPESYYEGALALGATPEETVFKVMLPAAKSIGEAMAVSMVAGNQPIIPDSLFSGVRTLTANIVLEMGYAADMHREALLATGVVLFIFILLINLSFSLLRRRDDK